jgi:hypothetical protein
MDEKDLKWLEVHLNCKDDGACENRSLSRRIKKLGWVKWSRLTMSFLFDISNSR